MWEVKRYLHNPKKQAARYNKAVKQLTKYVNGYYQPKNSKKTDGFKFGKNRFGKNYINDYQPYYIEYWYVGQGIIVYDYYELNSKRAYEPMTFSVPTTTNAIFLAALWTLLALMNSIGGRASPEYA